MSKVPIKKSWGLEKKFKRSDEKFDQMFKKSGGSKKMGGGQNRQGSKMLISLTFWCFFERAKKSIFPSRATNNEIIDRQGRKFLQRGIFDIFLHSPVLVDFLTFLTNFWKNQKLECWVLYSFKFILRSFTPHSKKKLWGKIQNEI